MLHIVNKSPSERNTLASCLRLAQADSAVLLIEDAVYAATRGSATASLLGEAGKTLSLYALAPDLEARGVKDLVMDGITLIDYGGFVDLVAAHASNQSWL